MVDFAKAQINTEIGYVTPQKSGVGYRYFIARAATLDDRGDQKPVTNAALVVESIKLVGDGGVRVTLEDGTTLRYHESSLVLYEFPVKREEAQKPRAAGGR